MQVTVDDGSRVAIIPQSDDADAFDRFALLNPDLRMEQRSTGEIIVMSPAGNESSNRNSEIIRQLSNWTKADGRGKAFDSNTVFALPDGSKLGPDAAWISKARLATFSVKQRRRFLPVVPEFIIELRSESDRLAELESKMLDWMRNGVNLAWLIDANDKLAWIYSAGSAVEVLEQPAAIIGQGAVLGFELSMEDVYQGLDF